MEVSGHVHVPAALTLEIESHLSIEQKVEWDCSWPSDAVFKTNLLLSAGNEPHFVSDAAPGMGLP
jgi:hypothetical protein